VIPQFDMGRHLDGWTGWLRLWPRGPGIQWKTGRALFSERNGHRRPFLRIGRLRVFWLRRLP
jgi:hypothetical protein